MTRRHVGHLASLRWSAALVATLALAGCAVAAPGPSASPGATDVPTAVVPSEGASGPRVVLEVEGRTAVAVLLDGVATDDLLAQLPLRIPMHDSMGVAFVGALPEPVRADDDDLVIELADGGLYVDPATGNLLVVHDSLGQSVPPPGIVPVGTVTAGLDALAAAGNRVELSLDAAPTR